MCRCLSSTQIPGLCSRPFRLITSTASARLYSTLRPWGTSASPLSVDHNILKLPRGGNRRSRNAWRKSRTLQQKREIAGIPHEQREIVVSAAGLEPATHALKGLPNQFQTKTCTSSL